MEIAAWLRGLRLEQYEPSFRDNGIDAAVLPKLTGEDLKEIGVARVGDRRKLLEAIAGCARAPRRCLLPNRRGRRPSLEPSAGSCR
jgi:hypothetical protein